MKKIMLVILMMPFSLFGQNQIEKENGEYFIKIDENYLRSLKEFGDSREGFDGSLTKEVFKRRFDFLNQNTALSIDYNDVTYTYVKKYLSYSWYAKIIGLSVYYFPLFESKLDKYGVPRELKYLAVVESALNPRASSWVGAAGLWQFMPATGAQYGLRKNDYVNAFYDPVSNADAGARYLRDLYRIFGDWNLAISAYNCGPGNVNKAIRRAGTKNYWAVRPYLPQETQAYVPSFIAVNYIFNFYKSHGIRPRYFAYNFFDLKVIRVNKATTLEELGRKFNYNVVKFANPQFTTSLVPEGSIVYVK